MDLKVAEFYSRRPICQKEPVSLFLKYLKSLITNVIFSVNTTSFGRKEWKLYTFVVKKEKYFVFVPYYVLFHLQRVIKNEPLMVAIRLIMLWSLGKAAMTERRLGLDTEKPSAAREFKYDPLSVIERHFIFGNNCLQLECY